MCEREILNEKEVSQDYRFSLSKLRNDRWLGKGLPYIKVSRSIYYRRSDIEEYLEKHKVKTSDC